MPVNFEISVVRDISTKYIKNPFSDKYQEFTLCNMDKAKKELGFESKVSISEGIEKYSVEFL